MIFDEMRNTKCSPTLKLPSSPSLRRTGQGAGGIRKKGFTLTELLIVVVIIAILASLGVPTYIRTVEKARAGEAISNLTLIRAGQRIYRLEKGHYTSSLANVPLINTHLNLDIEPEHWSYHVDGTLPPAGTFTATATRNAPGTTYDGTITIDQHGNWDGTSPFVPEN